MKIVGMMVVGPGEKGRFLEGSLKEMERLCDEVIIAGNNTDDETEKMIRDFGFWFYRDDREWGLEQPSIKTDLLKRAGKLHPDWVIALDADERFAPEFTRAEAEKLAAQDEIAWYFLVVNLYNDPEHFAHDKGIQRFWNIRFFKYLPEHGLEFQKKRLHCGLAPPIAYRYGWHAPFYLEHYGLMKKDDRLRKAERYARYDPNSKFKDKVYYEDLLRELIARPFNRQKLLTQLRGAADCQPRKRPRL